MKKLVIITIIVAMLSMCLCGCLDKEGTKIDDTNVLDYVDIDFVVDSIISTSNGYLNKCRIIVDGDSKYTYKNASVNIEISNVASRTHSEVVKLDEDGNGYAEYEFKSGFYNIKNDIPQINILSARGKVFKK